MRRELLLLRQMRDAAVAIRELVGDRSAEQIEADDLPQMIAQLEGAITTLQKPESDPPS